MGSVTADASPDARRHYGSCPVTPRTLRDKMHDPKLKKKLGQHHLRSGELCRPLVEYLEPEGQRVLEIGAGGGVLTAELLAAGGRLIACELDLEWAVTLKQRLRGHDATTVVLDALRIDWRRLPHPTLVAGNLPFNVGTRIIEGLLPHGNTVPRAAFMVQKEVADRLTASPGEAAYSSFSVMTAAYARVVRLGTVAPGSFRPPPKVSAAFVGLELRSPPLAVDQMPAFIRLVRLAFAQRRKTLRNSLASGLGRERSERLLEAAGLDPRCRAQELDLAAFVELFRESTG